MSANTFNCDIGITPSSTSRDSVYMYVSSIANVRHYPDNTSSDFTYVCPEPLSISSGEQWECAVEELGFTSSQQIPLVHAPTPGDSGNAAKSYSFSIKVFSNSADTLKYISS